MIHGAEAFLKHFGDAANDAVRTAPSMVLTDLFISVDLRDQNGNMLLIRIMKQNIKCSVVIQTGQRIVHGFISKAITPRPFCVQKYVRSPWLMVQKETLKI